MNCDAVIPTALAERLAARTGDLVAPTFCYGYKSQPKSGGGNHFSGTASLDGETLIRMTRDIVCEFARHGVRRMAVVDGHYENNMFLVEGIDLALRELRRDGVHGHADRQDPVLGVRHSGDHGRRVARGLPRMAARACRPDGDLGPCCTCIRRSLT